MKLSDLHKLVQALPAEPRLDDSAWLNDFLRSQQLDPGQLYQELEMDSRFADTHRDSSYAHTQVSLHSHNFYELLFCRSCHGVEYLVGAERYRLHKGDVVIVPPGVSHCPLLPQDLAEPYIRDVVWLNEEFMQHMLLRFPGIMEDLERYGTMLRTGEDEQGLIAQLFDQGIREAESGRDDRELAVIGNTITLLVQLRRACVAQAVRPMQAEKPELLDRVLQYIEEHMVQKITLADVAHHFFVSESTISQLFRKKMGTSFYHCVTQKRLIEAKSLITQGLPLEQIGERVGFTDYSAFYKAFKKEFGISPRQFRNRQVL